jgi:hypothetical protein
MTVLRLVVLIAALLGDVPLHVSTLLDSARDTAIVRFNPVTMAGTVRGRRYAA